MHVEASAHGEDDVFQHLIAASVCFDMKGCSSLYVAGDLCVLYSLNVWACTSTRAYRHTHTRTNAHTLTTSGSLPILNASSHGHGWTWLEDIETRQIQWVSSR